MPLDVVFGVAPVVLYPMWIAPFETVVLEGDPVVFMLHLSWFFVVSFSIFCVHLFNNICTVEQ